VSTGLGAPGCNCGRSQFLVKPMMSWGPEARLPGFDRQGAYQLLLLAGDVVDLDVSTFFARLGPTR